MNPLALFALANLKSDLGKLWAWLCHRSFWQLACMALAAFALVQHFQLIDARHDATKWEKQFNSEHAGRLADRATYTKAQADAAEKNKAQVAGVVAKQEKINEKSRAGYLADLDRLRAQAGAPKGAASGTPVSGVPKGTSGTAPEVVPLPADELLRAQELELQLNALIDWVLQQSTVNPN